MVGVLMATDDNPEALIWRVLSAAALTAVVGDVGLQLAGGQRLLGEGALIESIAGGSSPRALEHLFADVIAHWLDSGLLFALAPVPAEQRAGLREALSLVGAHRVPPSDPAANAPEWAVLRLAEPLVLVWDLESVLQPSYAASLPVRRALEENRHAMARFFANSRPGEALLHLQEEQLRRRVAEWARQRLAQVPTRRLVLGLGRQFSRDIVGDTPTLAVDLERFLTWQGYEGGVHPRWGSPRLELQLAMAREISARAILLVPFLESAEPVLQVVAAARTVGLRIDEVLVGVTMRRHAPPSSCRTYGHRCGVVVPLRGILAKAWWHRTRGWSIVGRAPGGGFTTPSLNDCLPYHYRITSVSTSVRRWTSPRPLQRHGALAGSGRGIPRSGRAPPVGARARCSGAATAVPAALQGSCHSQSASRASCWPRTLRRSPVCTPRVTPPTAAAGGASDAVRRRAGHAA
jgi:hypothetical protein